MPSLEERIRSRPHARKCCWISGLNERCVCGLNALADEVGALGERDVEIRKRVLKIQEQVNGLSHEILDLMAVDVEDLLADNPPEE